MAGVEFVAEEYPDIARPKDTNTDTSPADLGDPVRSLRPCIRVQPSGAHVLHARADGTPLLVRRNNVFMCLDPIELGGDAAAAEARRHVYSRFLEATTVKPLPIEPDEPWLHVMAQPTVKGIVHMVYNRRTDPGEREVTLSTAAGAISLNTRNRWPALAAVTNDGRVVAVNAFGNASIGKEPLLRGSGMKALLSLDGQDLRQSKAILIAPFQSGVIELPPAPSPNTAQTVRVLDFAQGQWKTSETVTVDAKAVESTSTRTRNMRPRARSQFRRPMAEEPDSGYAESCIHRRLLTAGTHYRYWRPIMTLRPVQCFAAATLAVLTAALAHS